MPKISKKKNLTITDKKIFNHYLSISNPVISAYSFSNIITWKRIFEIFWHIIDGNLCLFFKNSNICFMYIEPQGENVTKQVIDECFKIMDKHNNNPNFSRIENVHIKRKNIYEDYGFYWKEQFQEYIYKRKAIVELKGNRFKSQRSSCNYFTKNYNFQYLPFTLKDTRGCITLLKSWKKRLRQTSKDYYFQALLNDTEELQEFAINAAEKIKLRGRVVKIDGKIKGYTFGYPINKNTWCVLFEVCSRDVKGISHYIFREFCRELKKFKYINTMDDSGVESIKKAKLLFKPAFTIKTGSIFREE